MSKLEHKPRKMIVDNPGTPVDSSQYYDVNVGCSNCYFHFKVWIMKGLRRAECKLVQCPQCLCDTGV